MPLDKDFLMIESGYDVQKEKNTSSSFQYFYNKLKTKKYRERHRKGYSKIRKIASHTKFKSILLETLREEKLKDEISHKLYFNLKKSGNNYPFFVKEKTVWQHIQEIINVKDIEREIVRQSPQLPPSRNRQQINKTSAKKVLYLLSIILAVFALLCIIATIILGLLFILGLLQFRLEIAIILILGILLILIAFFVFIIQEFIP
ncbi:MAG: hypothetical protein MGU50_07195 [Trichodesmium sp. MAG_R02]|nr:hypothetical protein [Trichodesmium sp. MAG_R02]